MSEKLKEAKELLEKIKGYMTTWIPCHTYFDYNKACMCNRCKAITDFDEALSLLSEPTGYYDVADLYDEAEPPKCQPDVGEFVAKARRRIKTDRPGVQDTRNHNVSALRVVADEALGYLDKACTLLEAAEAHAQEQEKEIVALTQELADKEEFWQAYCNEKWAKLSEEIEQLEVKNEQQAKRIEELEHRIDELTAIRISLETQCDQRAKRIGELQKEITQRIELHADQIVQTKRAEKKLQNFVCPDCGFSWEQALKGGGDGKV